MGGESFQEKIIAHIYLGWPEVYVPPQNVMNFCMKQIELLGYNLISILGWVENLSKRKLWLIYTLDGMRYMCLPKM